MPAAVDLFVVAAFTLHIVLCPYAKVEESFNLQAIHDALFFGVRDVSRYDHNEFPGVVPRTFLGALSVAGIASPFMWLWRAFGLKKIALQYFVRLVLAGMNFAALVVFKRAIAAKYGKVAASFFMLISGCQFHLMFYFGRTLPNTFALALVLCAYAYWIRHAIKPSIILFTFTIIIFRADTAVLFAPVLLWMLIHGGLSRVFRIILWGIIATASALACTIAIDSHFWQRWLWPEGEVLWLNTVQNKSHEWGTSPPLWYFYSALPRALLATALLIPFGISTMLPALAKSTTWKQVRHAITHAPLVDRSVWTFVWPVIVYLSLYSILPHKELRFIFNAIPILNMAAAVGASKLYNDRAKAILPAVFVIGCLAITALGSIFFFSASRLNYPGGHAFARLHDLHHQLRDQLVRVHIDVPAAMTGVSRFGEEYPAWHYSKDESVTTAQQLARFDFLVTAKTPESLQSEFELVDTVDVFDYVEFKSLPPKIHAKPCIYVLRNRRRVLHEA